MRTVSSKCNFVLLNTSTSGPWEGLKGWVESDRDVRGLPTPTPKKEPFLFDRNQTPMSTGLRVGIKEGPRIGRSDTLTSSTESEGLGTSYPRRRVRPDPSHSRSVTYTPEKKEPTNHKPSFPKVRRLKGYKVSFYYCCYL